MSAARLWDALARHARGGGVALDDGRGTRVTYAQLLERVDELAAELKRRGARRIAVLAESSPAVALLDLAALRAELPLVPIPDFFSDDQRDHVLTVCAADLVVTDRPASLAPRLAPAYRRTPDLLGLAVHARPGLPGPRLDGTARVTFTSGSTGRPKGVRLGADALLTAASSLATATVTQPAETHLAALPLSVLLENVGGLYRSLLCGARVALLDGASRGATGGCHVDGHGLLRALEEQDAGSVILVPGMLDALLDALEERGATAPRDLRFVGVGGAIVARRLLARARATGLPVFEGYGLTEAASVVTLNCAGASRPSSVGRPLPHTELRIDASGEIHVRGALHQGYLDGTGEPPADGWWPTGDLGCVDDEGFVHLAGRTSNVFITAFGRNVSPEWIERLLLDVPGIRQAAVFGEALAGPVAVLVVEGPDGRIDEALRWMNAGLPDYARVQGWIRAEQAFTTANGQWAPTGRPVRAAIAAAYGDRITDDHRQRSVLRSDPRPRAHGTTRVAPTQNGIRS